MVDGSPLSKTTTNGYGTFIYSATPLEQLAEGLAAKISVPFTELEPSASWSFGFFLDRTAYRDGIPEKHIRNPMIGAEHPIWYTKNPSSSLSKKLGEGVRLAPGLAKDLYADMAPRSEWLYALWKGVQIHVELDDEQSNIKVFSGRKSRVARHLERTMDAGNYGLTIERKCMVISCKNNETTRGQVISFLRSYFNM